MKIKDINKKYCPDRENRAADAGDAAGAIKGQLTIFAEEQEGPDKCGCHAVEQDPKQGSGPQSDAENGVSILLQENTANSIPVTAESESGNNPGCTDPAAENTGTEQAADAASALGKFGSADELLSAYNALEAEFTKRCQRLKQLAGEVEMLRETQVTESQLEQKFSDMLSDGTFVEKNIIGNEDIRNRVIAEYLRALEENKGARVMQDSCGYSVLAPVKKPKTLLEAKKLADLFIKG